MKAIGKWIKDATRNVFDPDQEERIKELSALLYNSMQKAGEQFSFLKFREQCEYTERDIELAKRRIYQTLLARAWQDDRVTEAEHKTLNWVISRLHIPTVEARDLQLAAARDRFAAALARAMDDGVLNEDEAKHLEQISQSVGISLGDFVRKYFQSEGEDLLRGIFAACTESGVLADDAWSRLGNATKRLGLGKNDLLSAVRLQAERFVEHVLADAKSDGMLSEREESVLTQLIQKLELNSESTAYVQKSISALRTIRNAANGKLPALGRPSGVTVRAGELVHYHAPATWLQRRILKSGERWDQHIGSLTITDNRLLFSSDTKSIDVRFARIAGHCGETGAIRLQRLEKPESFIRVNEDEPVAYAILEGAIALATQTRLAKVTGAPSRHIPREVRQRVWQRFGGQCAECGAKQYLEFDHVIPVAKGGGNTDTNVQLLCRACNLKKSDFI
jgi:tellurite resistance protein